MIAGDCSIEKNRKHFTSYIPTNSLEQFSDKRGSPQRDFILWGNERPVEILVTFMDIYSLCY